MRGIGYPCNIRSAERAQTDIGLLNQHPERSTERGCQTNYGETGIVKVEESASRGLANGEEGIRSAGWVSQFIFSLLSQHVCPPPVVTTRNVRVAPAVPLHSTPSFLHKAFLASAALNNTPAICEHENTTTEFSCLFHCEEKQ